jgi:hypothetical protein
MTVLRSPRSGTFNDWLSTLPTGPLVVLTGVVLAVIVVSSTIAMQFAGKKIDADALGLCVTVIVGCLGGGWGMYFTKRSTWQPDLTPVPMPGESLDPTDGPFRPGYGEPYHVVPTQQVRDYMDATAPSRPSGAVPAVPPA